jgi:WD40 repeat protein
MKDVASLVLWEPAWDIPQFECAVMRDEEFAFSPDGESLMIFAPKADQQAKLKLLRWRDGTVREGVAVNQSPGRTWPPVCSRDGGQCAVFEAGLCVVYEAATGKEIARLKLPAPSEGFRSGAFTAAGHFLADARDSVWDVTAGTKVWQAPEGQQIDGLSQDGRYLCVVPVGVFHDGNGAIVGKISFWDLAINQKVGGLQGAEEAGLGLNEPLFSPDGRWLFAPAAPFEPSESFKGAVWSVPDGRKQLTIRGPAADISGYRFSADGGLLALGQKDGGTQLWDVGRAELLFRWKPHEVPVGYNLAFAPGGTALAEQGFDEESVTVLDLKALRRQLATMGLDW